MFEIENRGQKENHRDLVRLDEEKKRIFKRFGRFPHRNKILDRLSSQQEIKFLEEPGSSF